MIHTRSLALALTLAGTALCALPTRAAAQACPSGPLPEGPIEFDVCFFDNGVRTVPANGSAVSFTCSTNPLELLPFSGVPGGIISVLASVTEFDLGFTSGTNGNFSASISGEVPTTIADAAAIAAENFITGVIPQNPCSILIEQDLGVVRGSANIYSFAIGSFFNPTVTVRRTMRAQMSFNDTLDIYSPVARTAELPVIIAGSASAAESFGGDGQQAVVDLRVSGSVGGVGINRQLRVVSVSVIPEEGSINFTDNVSISLQPGITSIPINLQAVAELESRAVSAGFVAGATTAIIDFPNSIRIGRLRLPDGSPLPPDVLVRTRRGRLILQGQPGSGSPTPCNPADITGVGGPPSTPDGLLTGDDFVAFIAAFAAGEALADITGIGGPPAARDNLVTGDDFNAFIAAFAAGCP